MKVPCQFRVFLIRSARRIASPARLAAAAAISSASCAASSGKSVTPGAGKLGGGVAAAENWVELSSNLDAAVDAAAGVLRGAGGIGLAGIVWSGGVSGESLAGFAGLEDMIRAKMDYLNARDL